MYSAAMISPKVAETESEPEVISHRLRPYKIVGHYFGRSYLRLGLDNSGRKWVFLESVTFQPHAHILSAFVATSLSRYGHFVVEIALSHSHVKKSYFISVNTNTRIHCPHIYAVEV